MKAAGVGARAAGETYPEKLARELERELRRGVEGEVAFDAGSRSAYATDASNYRQTPIGVVKPRSLGDVAEAVAICRRFDAPILPRGAGTSLAGQACNAAVVLEMTKHLRHVLEIDAHRKTARVQPGLVLDHLQEAAAEFGLMFGPDPATHNHCTLGGMIGNNSCGVHSVLAGKTRDNVESLEILTYDGLAFTVGKTSPESLESAAAAGGRRGRIYRDLKALRDAHAEEIRKRMPPMARRSSGYELDALLPENGFHLAQALTGTEGTCVVVLGATVRLVDRPRNRALAVLGFPDVYGAAEAVPEILSHGPIGLEGMDDLLVRFQQKRGMNPEAISDLPDGAGWLLVEFGGMDAEEAEAKARAMAESLPGGGRYKILLDPARAQGLWRVREAGLGATARVEGIGDFWPGWEDSAVPPGKLPGYLRELRALFDRYGYKAALYGHFGQGCVHCRINFDLTSGEGVRKYRRFLDEAADLVVRYGGSLSGEHGDGQARAELLPKMYGETLVDAFREFKRIWDPRGRMNPGKVVDSYPVVSNLRLGAGFRPAEAPVIFRYPSDSGSLNRAVLRCVGIGECLRMEEGTMCPSYRVTWEEKHSTRGRARLLHDMLQGRLPGGFRSEAVKEALDLCLSCKGCLGDCPVRVDMATYKAEFFSGYYRGRFRPPAAYAMGLIPWLARAAAWAPGPLNRLLHSRLAGPVLKAMAGIAPQREMPRFAPLTFRAWHARRRNSGPAPGKKRILLWPDTFNNHFSPEIAASAQTMLEQAGFSVEIPERVLCCGRPLYDHGMLDLARRQLRQVLRGLRPWIREGIPLVGLEPSCISVFRNELPNLFPEVEDARKLASRSYFLPEFLRREEAGFDPPRLAARALFHNHCHQKALEREEPYREFLGSLGLAFREPETGCCGMAGSFGFEKEKYDVSMRIAERHLLPALRTAGPGEWILADGFSCREQMRPGSGEILHLAQALHRGMAGEEGYRTFMEAFRREAARAGKAKSFLAAGAVAGTTLAAAMTAWILKTRRMKWWE